MSSDSTLAFPHQHGIQCLQHTSHSMPSGQWMIRALELTANQVARQGNWGKSQPREGLGKQGNSGFKRLEVEAEDCLDLGQQDIVPTKRRKCHEMLPGVNGGSWALNWKLLKTYPCSLTMHLEEGYFPAHSRLSYLFILFFKNLVFKI